MIIISTTLGLCKCVCTCALLCGDDLSHSSSVCVAMMLPPLLLPCSLTLILQSTTSTSLTAQCQPSEGEVTGGVHLTALYRHVEWERDNYCTNCSTTRRYSFDVTNTSYSMLRHTSTASCHENQCEKPLWCPTTASGLHNKRHLRKMCT